MVKFFIVVSRFKVMNLSIFPRDQFRSEWKNYHELGYILLRRKNISILFGIVVLSLAGTFLKVYRGNKIYMIWAAKS